MKPFIAITMGDYNGIGPEIVLKSIITPAVRRACIPVLIGSLDVFEYYAQRLRLKISLNEVRPEYLTTNAKTFQVINAHPFEIPTIKPGKQTVSAGKFAGDMLSFAIKLCTKNVFHGMVTAPVSKTTMVKAGFTFPGQTEMVASLSGKKKATMMLIANNFRVGLATVHVPVKNISQHITRKLIADRLIAIDNSLKYDFKIRKPRIAVLGLNPHAGEFGLLGQEELRIISPAIEQARRNHIVADGPFPSDGFFGMHMHKKYDAILAMYHDQGLIPLKMSGFNIGVNYSAGLSVVRTSPDHGTAFSIAGKGIANPGSMVEAIKLAATIIHNRRKRT